MGLSARRPQLPSLNLPSSQRSERKDILIEQFDDEDGNHDRTTEIIFDARSAFRQDPTTPVTPLPGTPLIFDEIPSYRSATPVTPGFANGPNPFSFSFSQISSSSSSQSSHPSPFVPHTKDLPSGSHIEQPLNSAGLTDSLSTINPIDQQPALGLIPSFGTLNGLTSVKRARGVAATTTATQPERSTYDTCWSDRDLETLESFLLNPLRPLATPYPPGTLPPSSALDELTSQIIHFHRPIPSASPSSRHLSEMPSSGGMTSSRSAPSLQQQSHASHAVGRSRHRRTHSSSGFVWKHNWTSTRQKLYEVARKEALGDSREDRFKGRSDVKKRTLFTGTNMDSGPISPMPENMSHEPSFDFSQKLSRQSNGSFGGTQSEVLAFTGMGADERPTPVARSVAQFDSHPRVTPMIETTKVIRPISLLQRGKSFTAEDFDAALTLDEPAIQKAQTYTVGNRDLTRDRINPTCTTPSTLFGRSQPPISSSSPPSSEGPRTPEAPPGITLTSPSPCGQNRNEQMKAMGSPTPGSDDRPAAFGGLLDFGTDTREVQSKPRRMNRPTPLLRSRSTWDETQAPSMIAQFIQGPPLARGSANDITPLCSARVSAKKSDQLSKDQTPHAKRQKVQAAESATERQ